MSLLDQATVANLPGQAPVRWRGPAPLWVTVACLVGIGWPPLWATFYLLPPKTWVVALDMDWRLIALACAVIAVPGAVALLARERRRERRPQTRLGVVWRFLLYGALAAAAVQVLITLAVMIDGWTAAGALGEQLGATETVVLIYGVLGLPFALMVGISYALWAGLAVALIAFAPRPPKVRPRLGLLDG